MCLEFQPAERSSVGASFRPPRFARKRPDDWCGEHIDAAPAATLGVTDEPAPPLPPPPRTHATKPIRTHPIHNRPPEYKKTKISKSTCNTNNMPDEDVARG